MKFYLESLGCPKNLVDAQGMARLLGRLGHIPVAEPEQAQILLVNTCGFIEDAREESLDALRNLAGSKRPDQLLIATGCLSQRWGLALDEKVPGLDALLGTRRWAEIGSLVRRLQDHRNQNQKQLMALLGDPVPGDEDGAGRFALQGASAYLKIADGCDAPCAFCAIPLIKGAAVSRPAEDVVRAAIELVRKGVKEIVLIAQDTTAYGRDRGEQDALPSLIEAILEAVPDLHWLRLMYGYPGHVSPRLIRVMGRDPRICHYLDLPLQHAHPDVLRRMRRPANVDQSRTLVSSLRDTMPDLALRTSFIVGYPGETDKEFQALLDFVKEIRPDRMGVFQYSPEEGTASASLPGSIPGDVQELRYSELMKLQQHLSLELNQTQVGRRLDILIEGADDGVSVGRTYRDAPEIDGLVFLPGELPVGDMVQARISGAMEYDLLADLPDGR